VMRCLLIAAAALMLGGPALAQGHGEIEIPSQKWSFNGITGTFDRASAQRGFQVYKEVCSNCHSMKLLSYRDLSGIGLNDAQIKALAAAIKVPTTDDTGQPIERAGLPSDKFHNPFPNEKAARAANGGALPPDLSLITKAREDGPNYVYALLNGYEDPPADVKVPDGQHYNKYFPGHLLAMPKPLSAGQVSFVGNDNPTLEQEAHDVVTFLAWAANPELEARHRMGIKAVLFLMLMTGLTYAVKRKVWKDVH
jgi:ubiquinol-cytochrome c reductase cytochrome c1 subunit